MALLAPSLHLWYMYTICQWPDPTRTDKKECESLFLKSVMTVGNRTAKHNLHNKAHLAFIFSPTQQFPCFGWHILMGIKTRLDKMSEHVKINCENHKNHKKKVLHILKHTERRPWNGIAQGQRVEHIVTGLINEIVVKINCKNHEKRLTYIETHRKMPWKGYSTRTESRANIFVISGH